MNDEDQATLNSKLIEANCVIGLDSTEARDGSDEVEHALCDALAVYAALLSYQLESSPTGDVASCAQVVTDRLQARLRFFGEPV